MIVETKKGKLPVRYGMNAIAVFADLTGKSMNQAFEALHKPFFDLPPSEILAIIYAGFVGGAKYEGEDCNISGVDEVGDMIDEDEGLITRMFEVFNDKEEQQEEPKKK